MLIWQMCEYARWVQYHPESCGTSNWCFLPCGHSISHLLYQGHLFWNVLHFTVIKQRHVPPCLIAPHRHHLKKKEEEESNQDWWIWNWWQFFMSAGSYLGDKGHWEMRNERREEVEGEIARGKTARQGEGEEGSDDTLVDLWLLV